MAFLSNVHEYVAEHGIEEGISLFQEELNSLKAQEARLLERRSVLQERIPEIKTVISSILSLKFHPTFTLEVGDHIFTEANASTEGALGLWLGCEVMVSFSKVEGLFCKRESLKLRQ
eukprot:TRINITY_DN3237_c0_g1_i3.p1 TRINITY_DN3237_c0_g1~~TRINITY_DN3237_c0_g1_i3.p1  ORF type:complete len:117 (-),score=14.14 TRINITY_DN3237_c0_g1_i3:98-448(-)